MKKLIIGISIFVLYLIVPMILGSFLPIIGESSTNELIIRTVIYIVLLILFIYLYRDTFKKGIKDLKKKNIKLVGKIFIYLIITIVVMAVSGMIITGLFPNLEFANDELVNKYFGEVGWFMVFSTILYAPIVEEIVFRQTFRDIINNKWFYIIFSSLIFAFYHIGYNFVGLESLLGMTQYILMGIIFAYAYFKTDNIYVPISIHFLYNIFMLIIQAI